jgi:hypothetical protein
LRHHGRRGDIALVKYKKLVGGGVLQIVNTVPHAPASRLRLAEVQAVVEYIDEQEMKGAPGPSTCGPTVRSSRHEASARSRRSGTCA